MMRGCGVAVIGIWRRRTLVYSVKGGSDEIVEEFDAGRRGVRIRVGSRGDRLCAFWLWRHIRRKKAIWKRSDVHRVRCVSLMDEGGRIGGRKVSLISYCSATAT